MGMQSREEVEDVEYQEIPAVPEKKNLEIGTPWFERAVKSGKSRPEIEAQFTVTDEAWGLIESARLPKPEPSTEPAHDEPQATPPVIKKGRVVRNEAGQEVDINGNVIAG